MKKNLLSMSLFLVFIIGCQEQASQVVAVDAEVKAPEVLVDAPIEVIETQTTALQANFEISAITLFNARPHYATVLGVDQKMAGGSYNDRLDDYSPEIVAQLKSLMPHLTPELSQGMTAAARSALDTLLSSEPELRRKQMRLTKQMLRDSECIAAARAIRPKLLSVL